MRRIAIVLVCAVLIAAAGCVGLPAEARLLIANNAALQARTIQLLDAGEVSRPQLEANARANAANWQALNALIEE